MTWANGIGHSRRPLHLLVLIGAGLVLGGCASGAAPHPVSATVVAAGRARNYERRVPPDSCPPVDFYRSEPLPWHHLHYLVTPPRSGPGAPVWQWFWDAAHRQYRKAWALDYGLEAGFDAWEHYRYLRMIQDAWFVTMADITPYVQPDFQMSPYYRWRIYYLAVVVKRRPGVVPWRMTEMRNGLSEWEVYVVQPTRGAPWRVLDHESAPHNPLLGRPNPAFQ
jgi:hypothetical protein